MEPKVTKSLPRDLKDRRACKDIPEVDQPSEEQVFNLQNIGKDDPQGSFECVRKIKSSRGVKQLYTTVGENIIKLYSPSYFCLATRKRLAKEEEDSSIPRAKLFKPDEPVLRRKVPVQSTPVQSAPVERAPVKRAAVERAAEMIPAVVPKRKELTTTNPALPLQRIKGQKSVSCRPYKDRVIHLLALRSYKKPELLARLQKDGICQKDKNTLGVILQQVAKLNPKDNSYFLKDIFFKSIQKDWPGYSETEKQSLELILSRKSESSQNTTSSSNVQAPVTANEATPLTSQKEPDSLSFYHPQMSKKKRISRVPSGVQFNGKGLVSSKKTPATYPLLNPPSAAAAPFSLSPPVLETDISDRASTSEGTGMQGRPVDSFSPNSRSISGDQQQIHTSLTHRQIPTMSMKPGKSMGENSVKLHRKPEGVKEYKEEDTIKMQDTSVSASSMKKDLKKQETAKLEKTSSLDSHKGVKGTCTASEDASSSASEQPDYLQKYVTIVSYEQYQRYIDDFNAEYDEYRSLHARVESVIRKFTGFREQWMLVCPGSNEYGVLQHRIIQDYREIKQQANPSYNEEKHRCNYLHNKLSHIKSLVSRFEREQSQLQHYSSTSSRISE